MREKHLSINKHWPYVGTMKLAVKSCAFLSYTHKDINNNSNTNTYTNTGGLCRFGCEQVYSFLALLLSKTRRERQFLKAYAKHTMLTPPPNARRIFWCLWYLPVEIWKTQSYPSTAENSSTLSISSNSQDHLFWAWYHPHSSPVSCLKVYYDICWLSHSFRSGVRLHCLTMHPKRPEQFKA